MLRYPDGGLEDTRESAATSCAPSAPIAPYRLRSRPVSLPGVPHRDHRAVGIVTTDAVYPFARDHLHFPEHIVREGLEPHKVRELWYWGADEPTSLST